jgi:hypothetical protein
VPLVVELGRLEAWLKHGAAGAGTDGELAFGWVFAEPVVVGFGVAAVGALALAGEVQQANGWLGWHADVSLRWSSVGQDLPDLAGAGDLFTVLLDRVVAIRAYVLATPAAVGDLAAVGAVVVRHSGSFRTVAAA